MEDKRRTKNRKITQGKLNYLSSNNRNRITIVNLWRTFILIFFFNAN